MQIYNPCPDVSSERAALEAKRCIAIGRLIEDDSLRKRMGAQGRKTAERFRIDAVMAEWERLFRSLADTGRSS